MAKRMSRLYRRANNHNGFANILEDMSVYTGISDSREARKEREKNLSFFEKRHERSLSRLHHKRLAHSAKAMKGHLRSDVDERVSPFSFAGLANGGPGNPAKRADNALDKRDKLIRNAEGLRRAAEAAAEAKEQARQAKQAAKPSKRVNRAVWRDTKKQQIVEASGKVANTTKTAAKKVAARAKRRS